MYLFVLISFFLNIRIKNLKISEEMEYEIDFPGDTTFCLLYHMHVFLDQSDDARYRIIILRWNNIDYAKTINLLSYIPFAVEILIVEDSSVNDKIK